MPSHDQDHAPGTAWPLVRTYSGRHLGLTPEAAAVLYGALAALVAIVAVLALAAAL